MGWGVSHICRPHGLDHGWKGPTDSDMTDRYDCNDGGQWCNAGYHGVLKNHYVENFWWMFASHVPRILDLELLNIVKRPFSSLDISVMML